jgi:dTDP-4-amino-4,6-dideoxygalactose transaminase
LGIDQLRELDGWCAHRQQLAAHYFLRLNSLASETGLVLPAPAYSGEESGHSWNMFCVLLPLAALKTTRKQFIDAMHAQQIGIGVSYEAMHLTTLFRNLGQREGTFPNAERIARETVTLPLHAGVTLADVDRVCSALHNFLRANRLESQ